MLTLMEEMCVQDRQLYAKFADIETLKYRTGAYTLIQTISENLTRVCSQYRSEFMGSCDTPNQPGQFCFRSCHGNVNSVPLFQFALHTD